MGRGYRESKRRDVRGKARRKRNRARAAVGDKGSRRKEGGPSLDLRRGSCESFRGEALGAHCY